MRLFVALGFLAALTATASALTPLEEVKILQSTEVRAAAAIESGDASAVRRLDTDFTQQLQALLASDASSACKMAGNAMQGLLVSALLPSSAKKREALENNVEDWARNMGECEWELQLPSRRLITP